MLVEENEEEDQHDHVDKAFNCSETGQHLQLNENDIHTYFF